MRRRLAAAALTAAVAATLYWLSVAAHKHATVLVNWSSFIAWLSGRYTLAAACYRPFGGYDQSSVTCMASFHYYLANLLLSPVGIVATSIVYWIAAFRRPAAAIMATLVTSLVAALLLTSSPFVSGAYYLSKNLLYRPGDIDLKLSLLLPNAIVLETAVVWVSLYTFFVLVRSAKS